MFCRRQAATQNDGMFERDDGIDAASEGKLNGAAYLAAVDIGGHDGAECTDVKEIFAHMVCDCLGFLSIFGKFFGVGRFCRALSVSGLSCRRRLKRLVFGSLSQLGSPVWWPAIQYEKMFASGLKLMCCWASFAPAVAWSNFRKCLGAGESSLSSRCSQ